MKKTAREGMSRSPNPVLLATPVYVQLSFLCHWSGAPEHRRYA